MPVLRTALGYVLTLAFSLAGQALLKLGVRQALGGAKPSGWDFVTQHLIGVFTTPMVIAGILMCGIGAVCWMFVLSSQDLGRALPVLGSLAYMAMFAIGTLVLKEEAHWINFVGILVIIAGVYLISFRPAT